MTKKGSTLAEESRATRSTRVIPWRRIGIYVLTGGVAVFFLILIVDKMIMPWYVKSGSVEEVPEVVGMPYAKAEEKLREKGFEVKEAEPRYSDKYPSGTVLMQLPYGGSRVKEGRRIYLTRSSGVEMVEVPDMVGMALREARIGLMRKHLDVGEISYEYNDTIMRDLIFGQSVPAGVGARPGTKIDLMISRGPSTRYTLVPNLIGLTLDEARARLANAGLALGAIDRAPSEFDINIVIEQGTEPYARIPEGEGVSVTVASGSDSAPPDRTEARPDRLGTD